MSEPDPHKSRRIPIAAVKGLSKHIHGDLIRVVMEYADIPQLQHECILRSHFSDRLSLYKEEVAVARETLWKFVDDKMLPSVNGILEDFHWNGETSSVYIPDSVEDAFEVIFRYRAPTDQEKWDILRDILCQRHSIRISKCKEKKGRYLDYTVDVPDRIADDHLNDLLAVARLSLPKG
eukprot:TRINITY_DN3856_c1_g2_i4.p1 TRINITY_DN3856_c1_g2~~TRINITY_DN3856_c1_g2_i4.p1  ORF type:complete len:178 (+),score=21.15 TRINITY_DN3856_c1_g2_i4:50-583(+)